jgi:hypothetical protein
MALAIHPYISGQPPRIRYLESIYDHVNRFEGVLHWNGAQILDLVPGTITPRCSVGARGPASAKPGADVLELLPMG